MGLVGLLSILRWRDQAQDPESTWFTLNEQPLLNSNLGFRGGGWVTWRIGITRKSVIVECNRNRPQFRNRNRQVSITGPLGPE